MLKSVFDGVCAAGGAAAVSALPSFVQQYAAGVSNRSGELTRTMNQGLIAPGRMIEVQQRADDLSVAAQAIHDAGGLRRIAIFFRHLDADALRETWRVFEPGVQFSTDGLYLFLIGIVAGLMLSNLVTFLMRRAFGRRRRTYA